MRNTTAFAHDVECMCPKCLMADLDAHIIETRGQDALSRINLTSDNDRATVEPVKTRNLNAGQRVGNGYVRQISSKQEWLINKLIKERDISALVLLPGQTIDPEEIKYMGVKGGTALIDKLFNCPEKPQVTPNDSVRKELSGSPKQIEWITKGLNGKPSLLQEKGILTESGISALYSEHQYSAKAVIDALLKMPAKKDSVTKEELTEGMYTFGERIFKVYMNRANTCMLTKELIEESFEYLGSAQWKLPKGAVKMTLDEAKKYGRLTGTCCQCGTKLTDENSIAEGIGPICAGKF